MARSMVPTAILGVGGYGLPYWRNNCPPGANFCTRRPSLSAALLAERFYCPFGSQQRNDAYRLNYLNLVLTLHAGG
jgi:hypothetical protein